MTQDYPGNAATIGQLLTLADEYRRAARVLFDIRRRGHPLSLAPFRLTAIHAVELYLNALLRSEGHEPVHIRNLQHDLATRAELAQQLGMGLRKRTAAHLADLAKQREYLVSRYGPEMVSTTSHITRLMATLDEVAEKSIARIEKPKAESKTKTKAA
jgi:hypothetical protein